MTVVQKVFTGVNLLLVGVWPVHKFFLPFVESSGLVLLYVLEPLLLLLQALHVQDVVLLVLEFVQLLKVCFSGLVLFFVDALNLDLDLFELLVDVVDLASDVVLLVSELLTFFLYLANLGLNNIYFFSVLVQGL